MEEMDVKDMFKHMMTKQNQMMQKAVSLCKQVNTIMVIPDDEVKRDELALHVSRCRIQEAKAAGLEDIRAVHLVWLCILGKCI